MGEWRRVKLGDLLRIKHGFAFKGEHFCAQPTRYSLVTPGNFAIGGGFQTAKKYYDGPVSQEFVLTAGDLLVTMTDLSKAGDTLGYSAIVPHDEAVTYLHNQRVGLVDVVDPSSADPAFLQWIMRSAPYRQEILASATGTTVRHTSPGRIAAYEFLLPRLAEQRAIAGVLGALDDKIESNRRIVSVSMSLAETAFVHWRSNLQAERVNSFGGFADVFGGATPSTSEADYWGGEHVWVAPRDITALKSVYLFDSERHITDLGLARSSTTLHPPGSIFMTSRATIGAFAINQVPCAPNQGFIVVRPRDPATRWFLFHEMRSRVAEMQDRATGTTFRELSRGSFREMTLSVPVDPASIAAFDAEVSPLHARAAASAKESESVAALRDTLLPELLSGRLRVREAEEMVGSV